MQKYYVNQTLHRVLRFHETVLLFIETINISFKLLINVSETIEWQIIMLKNSDDLMACYQDT